MPAYVTMQKLGDLKFRGDLSWIHYINGLQLSREVPLIHLFIHESCSSFNSLLQRICCVPGTTQGTGGAAVNKDNMVGALLGLARSR